MLQKLDEFNLPMIEQPLSHDDRHMSDNENEYPVCVSLGEMVNGSHMEYCSNCGKKIEKPILSKGYVFCSDQCRESFTTSR